VTSLVGEMPPAVLKTCSLGTVLVGRPIKRQRQPLAGRVIQVEVIDRLLFTYFCKASSVNTACGNSVSCIKGIKRGHNRRAAGSGRAGTSSAAAVGTRAHCWQPATSVDRLHRQIFAADTNC